ncbi:MAG: hypothetical protein A2283_03500 [Lentisphaerae bacterium RIFOXYA12_FULL_48_11]|nr:MAG: hypothetical protein A2283_03500 [Lentisphaerae bacterium RIFOXYA12_FULL_48_11]
MQLSKRTLTGLLAIIAVGTCGCAGIPRLFAPMQPDGWSAQPVSLVCRFDHDAELDPATLTPVGDNGYYLYILTKSGNWDYRNTRSFLISHARQPWGHSWLILESPTNRLECGLNGNFGREKPTYGDGINQKFKDGDPNPISYLWETMSDGEIEIGNGNRTPTFVWRMPITRQRHQQIYTHVIQWKYGQIGVRANNCVDMVTEAAELAGINLIHRVRLTLPTDIKILWKRLHIWTDPKYRILEYSTPDVMEVDLRHLARFGIGSDVTKWYLDSNMAAPKSKDKGNAESRLGNRAEDGI